MHTPDRIASFARTLAAWLLLAVVPLAANAQVWTSGCNGCHGGTPPSITDFSSSTTLGLSESWMSSAIALRARVNQAGTDNGVALMSNLSQTDADEVFAYFVNLRDAAVTTPAPAFANTLIAATSTASFSFDISNYRKEALGYSLSIGGTASGDFAIQSHTVSGAGCTVGSVPAATSLSAQTCTVNLTVGFTPGAAGTRSASLGVDLSTGGAPQPLDRSFGLSGIGLEALVVATTPLTFTAAVGPPAGTASNTLVVTDNKGDRVRACLVDASLALGFSFPDDYTITTPNVGAARCATYDPGAPSRALSFGVSFTPGASGPRNAMLEVQRLDTASQPTGPLFSVPLLGNRGAVAMANAASLFDGVEVEVTGSVSAQRSVTISSRGNDPLVFTGFSIAPAGQTEYALAGGGCQALPGSQLAAFTGGTAPSCLVTVNFDPSATGPRTATLNIATSAGPIAVGLNGIGSLAPRLQVLQGLAALASGDTLDFGQQTIGGIYPTRQVKLHNLGTSRGLELHLPAAPGGFALTPNADCLPVLAPGADCTLDIGFAPTVTAPPYDTTVAFTSRDATTADPLATFNLRLTGQGVTFAKPALVWRDTTEQAVTEIVFADTEAGQVRSATVRLRDIGPGGVQLQVLNAVGADAAAFTVSLASCSVATSALPANMFQGGSCDFTLQFAPTTAGPKAASLQVISSGATTPSLVVRGTGIASVTATALQLSANSLGFGDVAVGAQSAPQELTLMALGTAPLRITSLDVTGPYAAQSQTCGPPPFLLPPGTECKLAVAFAPTAAGAATGQLSIGVEGGAPTDVALSANGTPEPDVSGGGCTLARGETLTDPTLWLLLLAAALVLAVRRRRPWR